MENVQMFLPLIVVLFLALTLQKRATRKRGEKKRQWWGRGR